MLSLTIMALLVLVVLTAAGFLNLESRLADLSMRGAMARHNALMSGRLAVAQLQLLAGPDQRVTATAGIIDTTNTTWGAAPTNPNYALYTGVWHAGTKADSKGRLVAPLQRSANGYLYDTRFSEDGATGVSPGSHADGKVLDWSTDRERTTGDSRLLGWLVSGNEGLPLSAATYTGPRTAWTTGVTTRIPLLGAGSAGATASTEGTLAAPTGRVELPPVSMPGPVGVGLTGRYAWWVGDEGVKARVNLLDAYAGLQPDDVNVAAGGYYRLMTSQRNNFTLVKDSAGTSPFSGWDTASATAVANAADFSQLKTALALAAATDLAQFYHDISFSSLGLHTNTLRGGLKRDLTAYLNLGGASPVAAGSGSIAAAAWVGAAPDPSRPVALPGVSDTAEVLGDLPWLPASSASTINPFAGTSPRYGLMRHWFNQAASWTTTGVPTSLPSLRTSATAASAYSASNDQNYMVARVNSQQRTAVHPVLSQMNIYFRPAYDSTLGGSGVQAYMLVYPRIVLWNPWNVPIASQPYVVDVGNRFIVRARVNYTTSGGGSGTMIFRYGNNANVNFDRADNNAIQWNPGLSAMAFVVPATDFKPGEALVFGAPVANTGTMGTSVTRPYTSAGTQVLEPAQLVSGTNPTPYFKASILAIPSTGVPGDPNDFTTYARMAGGITSATYQFATGPGGGYDFSLQYNVMTPNYPYQNMTGQSFLLDGSGTQAYQMMDSDGYQRGNLGRWISAGESPVNYVDIRGANPGPVLAPSRYQSINYRLMWHDEPGTVGSPPVAASSPVANPLTGSAQTGLGGPFTSIGWVANRQFNLFVQNNVRAPRFVRSPWDLCVWRRGSHDRSFGIWTNDRDPILYTDNQYAPFDFSGRRRGTPFFSATNASSTHVYTLYDLPNSTLGVVSLGQFQHAPFAIFPWQPSLALGNGYADPSSPAATSAMLLEGTGGHTTLMASTAAGGNFNAQPDAALQRDEITSSSYFSYDLAFELNASLWDGWFLSTIPHANNGWTSVNAPWAATTAFPNSRITPLGSKQLVPDSIAASYTPSIPSLYYASASTAVAGAFNVNSTSVRAWTAFLSSQRNLKVNTALAGSDTAGTPFPRNLRPQQGKVQGTVAAASFDRNVWGGYRSLTDAEILTLATNIVAEVRKRGPFLSLADFVNRRLQPVGFSATVPAGAITGAAYTDPSVMGALQAAIEKSGLNANFGTPLDSSSTNTTYNGTTTLIQRDSAADYADAEDAMKFRPRGEARVAHRSAGAPGYLLQSDILQQLAPALTARSDTFTIRAYGQATDSSGGRVLAEAWCEIVVQRMPTPVTPDPDSPAAALNPQTCFTTSSGGVRTYVRPDLGRRFRIVQFRWLSPSEI